MTHFRYWSQMTSPKLDCSGSKDLGMILPTADNNVCQKRMSAFELHKQLSTL